MPRLLRPAFRAAGNEALQNGEANGSGGPRRRGKEDNCHSTDPTGGKWLLPHRAGEALSVERRAEQRIVLA